MNLTIKDLSASTELDQAAMTAVHGGDNGVAGSNTAVQQLSMNTPIMVGVGGPANTNIHVKGEQNSYQANYGNAGDSFLALFPFRGPVVW